MTNKVNQKAQFKLGQIVYHTKFRYRGVIVDADPYFQGTDEWYENVAKSKPDKNNPGIMFLSMGRVMRRMWLKAISLQIQAMIRLTILL